MAIMIYDACSWKFVGVSSAYATATAIPAFRRRRWHWFYEVRKRLYCVVCGNNLSNRVSITICCKCWRLMSRKGVSLCTCKLVIKRHENWVRHIGEGARLSLLPSLDVNLENQLSSFIKHEYRQSENHLMCLHKLCIGRSIGRHQSTYRINMFVRYETCLAKTYLRFYTSVSEYSFLYFVLP